MRVSPIVAALLLGVSVSMAQEGKPPTRPEGPEGASPSLFPGGYLDHDGLTAALRRAEAAHPGEVRVSSLAKSSQGRDVWLVTLRPRRDPKSTPRPSILIVANLEADHAIGAQVALGLIERLVAEGGEADRPTIYVVPRLNPDGAERVVKGPASPFRTNLRAMDRDRDGRSNEDGPEDLDGDGVTTTMRVADGEATRVVDEKDARLTRRADPAKGERAAFRETSEGIDNDGDGRLDEDPPGGVNLNRNWPYRWSEFDPEAGFSPASEPEVRALIEFVFDHPEIALVWSFGLDDNLKNTPKKPETRLDDADLPLFVELSRLFNQADAPSKPKEEAKPAGGEDPPGDRQPEGEAANPQGRGRSAGRAFGKGARRPIPGGPSAPGASTDGALSEWAYHQFGVVGLSSRLWASPELPEPAKGKSSPSGDGDARWLYWNDQVMGGRAFVSFKPFDHPTLGKVQVGGWRPGVRLNPPSEQIGPIAAAHFAFLKAVIPKLARLAILEVRVEAKGGGLFSIAAVVENSGYLPTALAQGVRTRKAPPVLVRLDLGGARLLAGRSREQIDALAGSGGRKEFRWLVLAPEGVELISLDVSSPKAGRVARTIELKK